MLVVIGGSPSPDIPNVDGCAGRPVQSLMQERRAASLGSFEATPSNAAEQITASEPAKASMRLTKISAEFVYCERFEMGMGLVMRGDDRIAAAFFCLSGWSRGRGAERDDLHQEPRPVVGQRSGR